MNPTRRSFLRWSAGVFAASLNSVVSIASPAYDAPLPFIHGNGSQRDWTWGCVALDDKDIRELFDAVPIGTPVTIEH